MLLKNPVIGIIIFMGVISACGNPADKFTPNRDNPYMVGKWTIADVDNTGALISKETMFFSIIEEDFESGNTLIFFPGDRFALVSAEGDTTDFGRYGISEANDKLELLPQKDKKLIRYELDPSGKGSIRLNPLTPGVITSLVLKKQNK